MLSLCLEASPPRRPPPRSGIPQILEEFLVEYCSRSLALSSRTATCFFRPEIWLYLAIMIDRSLATLCRSLSTRGSLNIFTTFGSRSTSKRSGE